VAKPTSKKEDIFPATKLTPLAMRWKELNALGRHDEASVILEEIIIGSTKMFSVYAQYEGYNRTVELSTLVDAAQARVVRWLLAWDIKEGPLFTFFTRCAKNAFRSEVAKELNWRGKYHTTDDSLEKFHGTYDHEVDRHEVVIDVRKRLEQIFSRWGSRQEIGCIRYLLECMVEENHNKELAIRSASYAWGMSHEMSKFFYSWSLISLREAMLDKIKVPFTEQDLLRHNMSYTYIPDLLNVVTFEQLKKIIAIFGGLRLKIPTISQVRSWREAYLLHQEIDSSDGSPSTIAKIAKKNKRSLKTAQELYEETYRILNPERSGEFAIYD